MEYIKLFSGIGLTIIFTWILVKNGKRTNFIHAFLRVDTILGMIAGVYLILTSAYAFLVQ